MHFIDTYISKTTIYNRYNKTKFNFHHSILYINGLLNALRSRNIKK